MIMALSASVCFAEDLDSVKIDSFTGEVSDPRIESATLVRLSSSCYFDRETGYYVYSEANTDQILCSAYEAMISSGPIRIDAGENVNISVYKDGEKLDLGDYNTVSESGNYVILHDADQHQVVSFQIVGSITGMIDTFRVPQTFTIYGARRDGADIKYMIGSVDMTIEGEYQVDYINTITNTRYEFHTVIDHTAPVIELDGLDEEFTAKGPVTVVSLGDAVRSSVRKDGDSIVTLETYKDPGKYVITVWDEAGNAADVAFTILVYFNISAWMAVVMLVLMLGGMGGYLFWARKNLRVR